MRIRLFFYYIKQGFSNIFSNSLMSLASISIVTASIIMFGVFILIGLNLKYVGDQIIEQCELQVFVAKDASRDTVRRVKSRLDSIPGIKEVILYTKEDRLKDLKESSSEENPALNALDRDNPFRDCYRVTLFDINTANHIEQVISEIADVDEVSNRQDIIQSILKTTRYFNIACFWLVVFLGAVSIFIISNTIKIGLFARRKEISIMKYVGATDWFIRWPFIVEGIIIGLLGAAVSTALIQWGYSSAYSPITTYLHDILYILTPNAVFNFIIVIFLSIGGGIGLVGSCIAIRKHLHV